MAWPNCIFFWNSVDRGNSGGFLLLDGFAREVSGFSRFVEASGAERDEKGHLIGFVWSLRWSVRWTGGPSGCGSKPKVIGFSSRFFLGSSKVFLGLSGFFLWIDPPDAKTMRLVGGSSLYPCSSYVGTSSFPLFCAYQKKSKENYRCWHRQTCSSFPKGSSTVHPKRGGGHQWSSEALHWCVDPRVAIQTARIHLGLHRGLEAAWGGAGFGVAGGLLWEP